MIRMADNDQEKLYLCILKLLEKGSNDDFKKLQEICKEISKDMPDLDIPKSTSREYTIDDRVKQQLTSVAREDLASFIPVETEGDGSCLFRALSFLCFGDQNRHRELRVRCIIEMALNMHRYLGDEDLFEGFNASDVLKTCNPNEFAEFCHIYALRVILKRKIKIICSSIEMDTEELIKLEEHYDRTLDPNDLGGDLEPDEPPLTIMLLLDDNHFVPLIPPEDKEEGDSGLGESLADNSSPPSTPKKTKGDGDHVEGFKPAHSSTPKKAFKDNASDDGNVKSEQVEDSDDSDDEIVDITSGNAMTELNELFECDIEKKLCKKRLSNKTLQSLTGPYKMADHKVLGIVKDGTVMFITKLIEVQFQIKWKTDDRKPERFNFYDFCDVEKHPAAKTDDKKDQGKTVHLKYDPRRAHVFTELYRETLDMKKVKRKEVFCLDKPKEQFCPDVYVRGKDGWVRICFASEKCEEVNDFEETFSWMHESLRKFVAEDVEKVTLPSKTEVNYFQLVTAAIKKPTLYWAVLEDTDFKSGDHLKLREIGKTQVYVGKADGGIMRRWIKDSNNHSKEMERCAKGICKMKKSFDVSRMHGILLVDARLLLAKIRKENNAVFLIQTFEKKDDLKKGETQHRKGKRIVSGKKKLNIVPYEDIRGTWTPKKMEFGMNKS